MKRRVTRQELLLRQHQRALRQAGIGASVWLLVKGRAGTPRYGDQGRIAGFYPKTVLVEFPQGEGTAPARRWHIPYQALSTDQPSSSGDT